MDDIEQLRSHQEQGARFKKNTLYGAAVGSFCVTVASIEHSFAFGVVGMGSLLVSVVNFFEWDKAVSSSDKLEAKIFYEFREAVDTWQTE